MSYLHETQSRGVGAVAALDLGIGARASGSPILSSEQAMEGFWSSVKKIGRKVGVVRAKKRKPVRVSARRYRGAPRKVFVPRKVGVAVPPPRRTVVVRPRYPAPRVGPVIKPAIPPQQPAVFTETITTGVPPTGILPGRPPRGSIPIYPPSKKFAGSHTPQGPTLTTAVAKKNMAQDAMAAKEQTEAELQVPGVTPSRKSLIIGGVIVAVIGGIYLYSRSKR